MWAVEMLGPSLRSVLKPDLFVFGGREMEEEAEEREGWLLLMLSMDDEEEDDDDDDECGVAAPPPMFLYISKQESKCEKAATLGLK